MPSEWTKDWPREPGRYWFCGWTNKEDKVDCAPELHLVRAGFDGAKNIMVYDRAEIYYKSQIIGKFKKCDEVEFPDLDDL